MVEKGASSFGFTLVGCLRYLWFHQNLQELRVSILEENVECVRFRFWAPSLQAVGDVVNVLNAFT